MNAGSVGAQQSRIGVPMVIFVLSLFAAMAVVLLNGMPLFYVDSLGYVDQGTSVLRLIVPQDWLKSAGALPADAGSGTGAGIGGNAAPLGPAVNSSRSAVYPLVLATLYHAHLLLLVPVISLLFTVVAMWLSMCVALRRIGTGHSIWLLVGLPLLAASAGSLPFYVAYLMPDIFAPVLILVCAMLFAFAPDMRPWEILLAAAMGLIAIVVHPSHLLIAAGMVPVLVAGSLLAPRRGWWIAPLVVGMLVLSGAAERVVFRSVVNVVAKSEATTFPFLTARLIADGPGLAYLDRHCPDPAIPTCKLHAALSVSDNPMRLTASNIIFKRGPELGSFRELSRDDQRAVAAYEMDFVRAVVREDPLAVGGALLSNTLLQAGRNSIEMTIPDPLDVARAVRDYPSTGLDRGRLIGDPWWMPGLEAVHVAVYWLSLAVVAGLVLWPRRIAWEIRLFALAVLAGILVNAFVCGAVSQPADRYGGRVIWLLPMLATTLALFAWPATRRNEGRR
jgi:hypothetical protein